MKSQFWDCNGSPPDNNAVRVLLIDDTADDLSPILKQNLEPLGFVFKEVTSALLAMHTVGLSQPDVVLLDLHFPGDDLLTERTTGGNLLSEIRQRYTSIPIVVFTTRLDDVDIPLEAFDVEPDGHFAKPGIDSDRGWPTALAHAMRDAIEVARFSRNPTLGDIGFLVGETKEMHIAAGLVRTAAANSLNVLIQGEPGTGKKLVAKAIHRLSGRKGRFEHLNCAGKDEKTLETKLFGYVSGAFIDSNAAGAEGVFELADGGTLFIDEIQRMPMALQEKLMLVIESRKLRRMGGNTDKTIDVRVVIATNHSLWDLVVDGLLREDLAYRFAVLLIFLPPLRQRLDDLPELYSMFVSAANKALLRVNPVLLSLRPETLATLQSHSWPGNIRELERTITSAVATARSNVLLPNNIEFLPIWRKHSTPPSSVTAHSSTQTPRSVDAPPKHTHTVVTNDQKVRLTVNELELLPKDDRWDFLKKQPKVLRAAIFTEIMYRLHQSTGTKAGFQELAAHLAPIADFESAEPRIRHYALDYINMKQFPWNQKGRRQ